MPKIKKLKRSKTFRYNINRKRLDQKKKGTGTIKCPEIRNAWNKQQTVIKNLHEMGLSNDPNKGLITAKQNRVKIIKLSNGFIEEDEITDHNISPIDVPQKKYVADELEQNANALRENNFRLPKGIIAHLSYCLDTYGLNYQAMASDEKNYDQQTWKQYRAKIRKFMSIPVQFNKYLADRNLDVNNLNWTECCNSDSE